MISIDSAPFGGVKAPSLREISITRERGESRGGKPVLKITAKPLPSFETFTLED
jgi:hypothetical protein